MASNNPMHVEWGRGETVVAFSHDKGLLKTNGHGDYFFRGTDDGRFACLSPDLERMVLDLGVKAGERIGVRKITRNRIATWQVRRLDEPVQAAPQPRKVFPHNGHVQPRALPETKYATPVADVLDSAPPNDWDDVGVSEPAPRKPVAKATSILLECAEEVIGVIAELEKRYSVKLNEETLRAWTSTLYIQRERRAS